MPNTDNIPWAASVEAAEESLDDFNNSPAGLTDFDRRLRRLCVRHSDGRHVYAPYTLAPYQVGTVEQLLGVAQELLNEVKKRDEEILALKEKLASGQSFVDSSIAYLDPDNPANQK